MYLEKDGAIIERFMDNFLPPFPVSIESVPALHFYPNGKFLQVSTMGCNFRCPGCVSRVLIRHTDAMSGAINKTNPASIIGMAKDENCIGIAFCINEPIASFMSFKGLAGMARSNGLLIGCSTNAYFSEDSLMQIAPLIDFVNVGIKGSSNEAYQYCGVRSSAPVYRNLKRLYESDVHVEAAQVYHYGREKEVIEAAKAVASISREIPFHVMRYMPFDDICQDLEPPVMAAETLCERLNGILDFVYLFNTPGTSRLNTVCPKCGKVIIKRDFAGPMGAMVIGYLSDGVCDCGYRAPITGKIGPKRFNESGFLGGYRLTRGYGMIESILHCLGVTNEDVIAKVWLDVMKSGYLREFYMAVNDIELYINAIEHFAFLTNRKDKGEELTLFIRERLNAIRGVCFDDDRPGVLYTMSHPMFALNATRFENALIEAAGGMSLNRLLVREGIPGVSITKEELERLSPDMILVSGLFSGERTDFKKFYESLGVSCRAVREGRIYHMYPSWDFGSPRWILGLMYLANLTHPEKFAFDITREADEFYHRFYGVPFESMRLKRHF